MRQALHLTVAFALALYGCAGSVPNPVLSYQPGDENRSCQGLRAEIASNEAETIRLASEKGAKLGYNVALGVAGAFLLVPWFFMDVKGKETGELNALRHRNRILRQFAAAKDCYVPESKVKFEENKPQKEKEVEKSPQ